MLGAQNPALDQRRDPLHASHRHVGCHIRAELDRAFVDISQLRISAIVDAHFSLIVDGETASRRTRRGGAQALGLNVSQSSTISLKPTSVEPGVGLVFGLV